MGVKGRRIPLIVLTTLIGRKLRSLVMFQVKFGRMKSLTLISGLKSVGAILTFAADAFAKDLS